MSTRSPADVEQLLRRTYADVAERTTVGSPRTSAEAQLSPVAPAARSQRRQLVAAAAVLALVVGGLVVLANRDVELPAGRGAPTRVLPGWVPRSTSPDGTSDLRPFALTELASGPERARITYASDAGSVTLDLDRTRSSLPDGGPVVVRGVEGRRTDSTLAWIGPDGALVEVSWTGAVDDTMIDSFVQGLAFVDDQTWAEVAGTGGFRDEAFEPIATVRIDADVPFEVEVVGDLHEGLSVREGPSGFLPGSIDRCAASVNYSTSDTESDVTGYVILAPGDVASAVVRPVGHEDRVIELTSLLPLADISIGGVVYEARALNAQLPSVDCEDES